MSKGKPHNAYFIGIGGIGMSALARYLNSSDTRVAGYDRVSTSLTDELEREGIHVHFDDDPVLIPEYILAAPVNESLVVYTPAIPSDHRELGFLRDKGFEPIKRSELLASISLDKYSICIAGTHGKTTVTSMVAHLLMESEANFSAFIGGILKGYDSNYLNGQNEGMEMIVLEADEFDRSFLRLQPNVAVITSVEADHLDIYGDQNSLINSFKEFANKLKTGGKLLVHQDFVSGFDGAVSYGTNGDYRYSMTSTEFGKSSFLFSTPSGEEIEIDIPVFGKHNVENAVASLAACHLSGIETEKLSVGLSNYPGVKRRFEKIYDSGELIYIDDYAHHPTELRETISAAKKQFPDKRVSVVFQPHLFTRTRDFAEGFAASLNLADEVFLLDIYPAREEPIEGVDSNMILELMDHRNAELVGVQRVLEILKDKKEGVLLTLGAGDIDRLVEPIHQILKKR